MARSREVRGSGVVLTLFGVGLAVLAFTQLPWYSVDGGTDSAGNGFLFSDLHQNADQLSAPVAGAYFDWLAWTIAVLLGVAGLAACVPWRFADAMRVVGFVLGVLGVAGTIYSLAQLFNAQHVAGGSDHGVLHNSTIGMWAALAGFAVAGLAAVRGPRPT